MSAVKADSGLKGKTMTEWEIFHFCLQIILKEQIKFQIPSFNFLQFNFSDASFDRPSDRCACIYKEGLRSVLIVKECVKNFLCSCKTWDAIFNLKSRTPLKVASLSNLPGFDFLGFMLAFTELDKVNSPKFSKLNIISLFNGWSNTAKFFVEDMQNYKHLFKCFAPQNIQLTQCDILIKCSPKAKNILMDSDVVLLVRPFYKEYPIKDGRRKHVKEKFKVLLSHVTPGAVVIGIDCETHCDLMIEVAQKMSDSLLFGPIHLSSQISTAFADFYKERYGCLPALLLNGSIFVWKSPVKASPMSSKKLQADCSSSVTNAVSSPRESASGSNISFLKGCSNEWLTGQELLKIYENLLIDFNISPVHNSVSNMHNMISRSIKDMHSQSDDRSEPSTINKATNSKACINSNTSPVYNGKSKNLCNQDSNSAKDVFHQSIDKKENSIVNIVETNSKACASTDTDSLSEYFDRMCHVEKLNKETSTNVLNTRDCSSQTENVEASPVIFVNPNPSSDKPDQSESNQIRKLTDQINRLVHSLESNSNDQSSIHDCEHQNHHGNFHSPSMCLYERYHSSNRCCNNFSSANCYYPCVPHDSRFGGCCPQMYPRHSCSTVTQNDCQNGRFNQSVRPLQGEIFTNRPNLVIPLQGMSSDTVAQILSIIQREQSGC